MKKVLFLGLIALLPFGASADVLVCPEGQMVESVLVSEGSPAIPGTAAWDEYVFKGFHQGDYIKIGHNYIYVGHNNGFYDKVHHVAVPEVPAVDPVYEDQCVVDPNYEEPLVCTEGTHEEEGVCVDDEVVVPSPEPAPIVKSNNSAPNGSSVFRKLCNLHSAFGVGFCPKNDPMLGVQYQSFYMSLIESLKSR